MPQKPFPLLKFKPELLQKVLPYFDIPDIVDLSLCSKNALEAVKSSEFAVVEINVGSNYINVMGKYDDCTPVVNWRLNHEDVSKVWHWRIVNGQKFRTIEHPRKGTFIKTECKDYSLALRALYFHFKEIFKCPTRSVCITEPIQDEASFCELLSVIGKCGSFVLFGGPLKHETVHHILKNLEVTTSFQISGVPKDFRTNKIFEHWIGIRDSAWVDLPTLCKMKCQNIDLYDSPLTNGDLKGYIEHWMTSFDEKLEKLQVVLLEPICMELQEVSEMSTIKEDHEGKTRLWITRKDGWKGWWMLDGTYFQFNVSIPCYYRGNVAVAFELTDGTTAIDLGIQNFISNSLFTYSGNHYHLGGPNDNKTTISLVPYPTSPDQKPWMAYGNATTTDEIIQDFIVFNEDAKDPPRISDAFEMIAKLEHHGDPGFVILVANIEDYAKKALSSANLLIANGYQIITVAYKTDDYFDELSSNPSYNFRIDHDIDQRTVSVLISQILYKSYCGK